jgi:hypothetical protein
LGVSCQYVVQHIIGGYRELSNDTPLNDDLDDEEGLLAELDENDPHSVDWLDEDDVILRDIADGQSKINVVLSIIGEGSVEGISCGQLWKRYIARSTALHYHQTWAKFIPNMFIKLAVCRNVLQDGEITLLLRLDRLLSTNLRQRYKVPSITKHHQDSRHVRDSTDAITDIYDLVCSSLQKSTVQKFNQSFNNEVDEALDLCTRLFKP